jgi:GTP-binding protein
MVSFRSAHYVISVPSFSLRPPDGRPEIALFGRSNVGKSTLINLLAGAKIAYVSKKAGKTRYLNYYLVGDYFYLVDAPGYGYVAYGSRESEAFGSMMEGYFANPLLQGALFVLDARRSLSEDDKTLLAFLTEKGLPFVAVFTKCDAAKQSELAASRRIAASLPAKGVFFSEKGKDIARLRALTLSLLH